MLRPAVSPRFTTTTTPMMVIMMTMMIMRTGRVEGVITCDAVTSSYESSVTCDFGVNINESKHNFNVQFYHPDLSAEPDTLLMCNWATLDGLDCRKAKDIRFDEKVSQKLTVKGPALPFKAGGKFVCQVVPPLEVEMRPCVLSFRDITPTTIKTTSVAPLYSEWLKEIHDTATLGVTLSVITLVIIIIFIIIFITFFACRHRFSKWLRTREKQQNMEMGTRDEKKTLMDSATHTAGTSVDDSTDRPLKSEEKKGLFDGFFSSPKKSTLTEKTTTEGVIVANEACSMTSVDVSTERPQKSEKKKGFFDGFSSPKKSTLTEKTTTVANEACSMISESVDTSDGAKTRSEKELKKMEKKRKAEEKKQQKEEKKREEQMAKEAKK